MKRGLMAALLMLFALACSSGDGGGAKKPAGELRFQADAEPSGSSVTLRSRELTKDRLVLEIVGHSISNLYGVAFRLKTDPTVLVFQKLESSPAWTTPAPLALGSEKTPGLIVATLTHKGSAKGITASEVVLGTITLELRASEPATIEPLPSRSSAVGSDGRTLSPVLWAGGKLVRD